MVEIILRRYIRAVLCERTAERLIKRESSTAAASLSGASSLNVPGILTEPDNAGLDDSNTVPNANFIASKGSKAKTVDTGDGCEDIGDCKKHNLDNEKKDLKKEVSAVAALGGGPAMPLGVGPHYPGPDMPMTRRLSKQVDIVGRSFGGAKPFTRKRKRRKNK